MLAQNARLRLKKDTHAISVSDGVYLRGNNNYLLLKGRSLYPLLERLIPHLDGNVTLAELTEGLDAEKKKMIINLLEKLFAHDFLHDISQDQPSTLHPEELAAYASDIAFIDSFQTSAATRFERFCEKRLLLIAPRPCLTALAQASRQCGVKQVDGVLSLEDEGTADQRPMFASEVSEQSVPLREVPCWTDEASMRRLIQDYDAVLHICDRPMFARAQLFNRLCVEEQKLLIQAITVDNQAWIGPLVSPESTGCWECAWRRQAHLSDEQPRDMFQDQPRAPLSQALTMPITTILANRLVFELFCALTQTGPARTGGRLSILDLTSLLSESHTFLPHPHCQSCQHPVAVTASAFLEQIQQIQQRDPLDPDTLFEQIGECVDEKLGLFTAIDEDNFVQVPLAVSQVHLSNPMLRDQRGPLKVIAAGTDTTGARLRAIQKACERYMGALVDRRRLLSSEAVQHSAAPVLSTEQLLGQQTSAVKDELWAWAIDLQIRQACLVPATRAFPALHDGVQEAEWRRGVASGMIWEEAVCRALLDWCNALTVARVRDAQQVYPRVDLAKVPMSLEGRHLHHLLTTAVGEVSIYDVTGALRVPTFATCLGEKVVTYSTHCDVAQALRTGFEAALQQCQSEQFRELAYALPPVPDLPASLRGDQWSVPDTPAPDSWSARLEWLLQRLQENGSRAFVLPLDHDPALARIFPSIVRVLLSGADERSVTR